jgi:hypothetical protein
MPRLVADDRTFGSRIIDKFTLLEIPLFGGVVHSLLGFTLPSGDYSFSEKSEDSGIYTNVCSFSLSNVQANEQQRHHSTTKYADSSSFHGHSTTSPFSSCNVSSSYIITYPLYISPYYVSAPSSISSLPGSDPESEFRSQLLSWYWQFGIGIISPLSLMPLRGLGASVRRRNG